MRYGSVFCQIQQFATDTVAGTYLRQANHLTANYCSIWSSGLDGRAGFCEPQRSIIIGIRRCEEIFRLFAKRYLECFPCWLNYRLDQTSP
jgi:hypothetical protein